MSQKKDKTISLKYFFKKYYLIIFFILIGIVLIIHPIIENRYDSFIKNEVLALLLTQKKDIIKNQALSIKDYIEFRKKYFYYSLRKQLRDEVNKAYILSYSIFNRNKKNMPITQIKELIKNSLRDIRFNNGRGYYFIFSKTGERILYPLNPSKEGENIINLKDAKGVYMIKEMIKLINRRAQGFFTYVRPHPFYKDKYYNKISFIKLFEPFNWIIGAGDYVENFEKELKCEIIDRLDELKLSQNIEYVVVSQNKFLVKSKNFKYSLSEIKNTLKCQPKSTRCVNTVFFVTTVPDWHWKVITYFDRTSLNKEIQSIKTKSGKFFDVISYGIILLIFLILFLLLIISRNFSKTIISEMKTFKNFFKKLPRQYITIEENIFYFKEFAELAKEANNMSRFLQKLDLSRNYLMKKISEEKNYNSFIIENIGIALIIVNKDEKIEFANQTALELLKYKSFDKIQGQKLHKILNPIDKDGKFLNPENCPVCGVFKTLEKSYTNNIAIVNNLKKKLPVSVLSVPVIKENRINKVIVSFRDISKDVERKSEIEKLRSAIDQSPVSIVITDTDGTIEYVNPFFCKITGYTWEEAIGNNPRVLKTKYNEKVHKELWDTIKSGKTWEGEFLNKKKDGSFYWEKAIISPVFNDKGEIVNFIAVKQDVTELKKVYKELVKAKEKAVSANLAKSAFLANMSHEIRTPMNAIIGFVELVLETELNETQKKYLELVKASSENLLKILNDILDLSKLESGKMDYGKAPFNLIFLIQRQISLFNGKASEKGLKLKYQIAENVPEYLIGDEVRLSQVIGNLLNNAIKFTEKGEVGINVEALSVTDKYCTLKFKIYDTGIGIPKNKLKTIFSPFIQADSSVTKQFGGTGLGLTISSKIIQAYNGEIWVESEEGKGSSFYFTLQLEISDQAVNRYKSKESKKEIFFKDAKVLVAEDNVTNQILIQEILKQLGIKPVIAKNGIEALKELAEKDYDVVLMDWHMPEMDGVEAVKILRQIEKGETVSDERLSYETIAKLRNRKFTIIALTAAAMVHEKNTLMDMGFDEYLSKPIKRRILARILKKYLKISDKADTDESLSSEPLLELNKEHLRELVGDNEEVIQQLLESFKNTLKTSIEDINRGMQENNFDLISFAAHTLKGAAATIGFNEIADVAKTIEIAAKNEDLDQIKIETDYLERINL